MVIFGEASVSIPLMHNVARNNMSATLHMPRTCANGPNLREVGIRKRQPNRTPPGTQLEKRTQCSVSGPGALCVGPWHSLALCVGPRRSIARCVGDRRSVSSTAALPPLSVSPGALCVGTLSVSGPRRSLCRGPALTVSGSPSALCVGALSVSGLGVLFVGPRRSLCVSARRSASGPSALCVGP